MVSNGQDASKSLCKLLSATLALEQATVARDLEILDVTKRHAPKITKLTEDITTLETELETWYRSLQTDAPREYSAGIFGLRKATNPALITREGWTWEKAIEKVKARWRGKFLIKPQPQLDKNAIKRTLTEKQLAKMGLALDREGTFFIELHREVSA